MSTENINFFESGGVIFFSPMDEATPCSKFFFFSEAKVCSIWCGQYPGLGPDWCWLGTRLWRLNSCSPGRSKNHGPQCLNNHWLLKSLKKAIWNLSTCSFQAIKRREPMGMNKACWIFVHPVCFFAVFTSSGWRLMGVCPVYYWSWRLTSTNISK